MKGTNGLTAQNDSGGPTLIMEDGEERILGVHSTSNTFATYTQDTRVAAYWTWLKAQSSEITDPSDAGLPKPEAGPLDALVSETGKPPADSSVGLEPSVEPDTGCSVGQGRGGPAALLLLLLLGLARLRP